MSKSTKPRNPDHVRRTNRPSPDNEVIQERLKSLLTPAVFGQLAYFRSLGLRDRILGLPVMVAAVLMILWRQVPSVCDLAKLLGREDVLWTDRIKVSQQVLSKRLLGGVNPCSHPLRLIEVRFGKTWYRYLTSVLDPAILPASVVADLYRSPGVRRDGASKKPS